MLHKSFWLLVLAAYPSFAGGLIVYRADGGALQFSDVFSITANGRDKVLIAGAKPEAPGTGKLPSDKLEESMLFDSAAGVPAFYAKGAAATRYLYPDGLPGKTRIASAEAWKTSRFAFKKLKADKTPVEVPATQLVAFLMGGIAELAQLCMDNEALNLIGGAKGAFAAQLELTAAAVAAYGADPAMAGLDRQVADSMRSRYERFELGIESAKSLDEGLQIAQLSAKAWPQRPEHEKYRKLLAEKRAWLDRRLAILRSFAAGAQWDLFLLAYRDFEKHQESFPAMMQMQKQALERSLDTHWKSGKERLARGEFRRAHGELKLASMRQPSNTALQKELSIAWTEYSRQAATARRNSRKQLSAGEMDAIRQSLHFASRYREQKRLDDALKSVEEAERIDSASLPMLLAKAEILGARNEIRKALATLDEYDLHAVDEERSGGNKLRNELMFQLVDTLRELKKQASAAWESGRFDQTLQLARRGLLVDENDPGILYYGGVASLVKRDLEGGKTFLKRYLEVSETLDSEPKQRMTVARFLTSLPAAASKTTAPESGEANWFSGKKLSADLYDCPVSLAFQPRIDRIEASNKLNVKFTWQGERLQSIVPTFEKAAQATGEKTFVFTYGREFPQVAAVDAGDAGRTLPADPDEFIQKSNVILVNHPLVDPLMVGQLTGRKMAMTVAGNRYFNPFVWERPYAFQLEYDTDGRVKSALQMTGPEDAGRAPVRLDFEWNGLKLMSIKGYTVAGGVAPGLTYERSMQYVQDKLVGEEIKSGGKTSRIKYVYGPDGQLVSAECGKDESLDSRSRDVFFASAGAAKARAR